MEFEQRKREVTLAIKLRDRLNPYVDGDERERKKWRQEMIEKARQLCDHSFGHAMVEAVGWMYENYACQYLGEKTKKLE